MNVLAYVLVALGFGLDVFYNATRFIAEGLPLAVCIASACVIDLLLLVTTAQYVKTKRAGMAIVAGLVAAFSVFCTSGAQDFAFSQSARTGEAQAVEADSLKAKVLSLRADVSRLDSEATALQASKAGQAIADMARYRSTLATVDARLDSIARAKGSKLAEIDDATKTLSSSTTGRKTNLYSYYSDALHLDEKTLALVIHFAMSLVLAGAGPIGILALGDTTTKQKGTRAPRPMSPARIAILEALKGNPMRPNELAEALVKNQGTVRRELSMMLADGQVEKNITTGMYTVNGVNEGNI